MRPTKTQTGLRRVSQTERSKMSQVSRTNFTGDLLGGRWYGREAARRVRRPAGFLAQRAAGLAEEDVVEARPGQGDRLRREPGAVERAQDLRDGRLARVDVQAHDLAVDGRFADVAAGAHELEHALGQAVDAEGDDVAGDLALELVGGP